MLGDNIRRLRKTKRISINNLSKMSGVSLGYLSDIENNKGTNPTKETLEKLALALEVTVDEFFKEEPTITKAENKFNEQVRLTVKEQEKLDDLAENMLNNLRTSLSKKQEHLKETDYDMINATVRTLLEEMTKNNKVKYTNKKNKNKNG